MNNRTFRLLSLLGTVGIILSIVGGVTAGNASSQSDLDASAKYRHIGAILFLVLYACICGVTLFCLANRAQVLKYRRKVRTTSTRLPGID